MKQVKIYITAVTKSESGVGTFGYVMECQKKDGTTGTAHGIGKDAEASKHRLYILALKEALERMREPCEIIVISDNTMMRGSLGVNFAQGWIDNWKNNGFTNHGGKKVLNADLWEKIHEITREAGHTLTAANNEESNKYNKWLLHQIKHS